MLNTEEIRAIIKRGENECAEFKEAYTKEPIKKALCAFSNDYRKNGVGYILIGVTDLAQICGVSDPDHCIEDIANLSRQTTIPPIAPEMERVMIDDKYVVLVKVPRSERRPHFIQNKCYIRIGNTNREADIQEIMELERNTGRTFFDGYPARNAYRSDLNTTLLREYFKTSLGEDKDYSDEQLWKLATGERFVIETDGQYLPTPAGLLLFSKNPERKIPGSEIVFQVYSGVDQGAAIVNSKRLNGNIFQMWLDTIEMLSVAMTESFDLQRNFPVRKNIYEYPMEALREVVANAIIHRSYDSTNSPITIKMFDDRLEVYSPGSLFGSVTKENFGTITDYRNPIIANAFRVYGAIDKIGQGINLINASMHKNGSTEPRFIFGDTYLTVVLPAHTLYRCNRLYRKALELEHGVGDKSIALKHYLEAIELDDNFPEAWAGLGRLEWAVNSNYDKSRNAFTTAIRIASTFEKAYLDFANVEYDNGGISKARLVYRQGTKAVPESSQLWYAWANRESINGDHKMAYTYFKKALDLNPDNIQMLRAFAHFCSYRVRRYNDAANAWKTLVEISDNEADGALYFETMKAYINASKSYDECKKYYQLALSSDFRHLELFLALRKYANYNNRHDEVLNIENDALNLAISLPEEKYEVFIGGLPNGQNKGKIAKQVAQLFIDHGIEYLGIRIINLRDRNSAIGFVTVPTNEDVSHAISSLNGCSIQDRRIVVQKNRRSEVSSRKQKNSRYQK